MFSPRSPAPTWKPAIEKGREELGWDQMNLPEVGEAGSATGEVAVPNECAGVGVVFDAVAFLKRLVQSWPRRVKTLTASFARWTWTR
jgi:hypothetical protein